MGSRDVSHLCGRYQRAALYSARHLFVKTLHGRWQKFTQLRYAAFIVFFRDIRRVLQCNKKYSLCIMLYVLLNCCYILTTFESYRFVNNVRICMHKLRQVRAFIRGTSLDENVSFFSLKHGSYICNLILLDYKIK